jgi:hypothetical protein
VTRFETAGDQRHKRGTKKSMKILVHVGLHRAASTALQDWLASRRAAWTRSRVFVHDRMSSGRAPSPFALLVSKHAGAIDSRATGQFLRAALSELSGEFDAGIVSDENLLGAMPGPQRPAFARLQHLCTVLDELAGEHEIVPVIVVREHVSWLRSLHRIYQSRGGTKGLGHFTVAMGARDVRFMPVLRALSHQRRIIAGSLELIEQDGGETLLGELCAALGVPREGLSLARGNASPGPLQLRIAAELGAHHAVLAGHGGPRMAELGAGDAAELVDLVHQRAVKVAWAAPPARRMNRAIAFFRAGTPPVRRLPLATCRAIVAKALDAEQAPEDLSALPLDAFAADRQSVAAAYLPEWRNHTS